MFMKDAKNSETFCFAILMKFSYLKNSSNTSFMA